MASNYRAKKEVRRNYTFPVLLSLVVVSMVLGVCTLAPLGNEDRISIRRGIYLFILGLIFFSSLFNFMNHLALKTYPGLKFRKKYQLNVQDIFDISNKIVSSVQAALSCVTGVIVCTYSCTRSLLHTSHYASEAYAWFGASYFFYDVWSMYRVHSTQSQQQQLNGGGRCMKSLSEFNKIGLYVRAHSIIIMHHLFIGSFGFLVIVYLRGGLGDCVFGYVYLMELSTPFVSLRGVLSRLGMKTSRIYVFNGLLMLATFFFCRVLMFPYVCYLYAHVVGLPYFQAIMSLPRGCKIAILILLLPQVYWFWLMLKGAVHVFRVRPQTHKRTCVVKSTNHFNQYSNNHNS